LSFSVQYDTSLFDLVGFNYMDGMSHDDIQNVCQLFDVEELASGDISFSCASLFGEALIPARIADVLSIWVQAKAQASGVGEFSFKCNSEVDNWAECVPPAAMQVQVGECGVVHPEVHAMHNAMNRQTSFAHTTFANTSSMSLLRAAHTTRSAEFMANAMAHSSSLVDGASKTWSNATVHPGKIEAVFNLAVTSRSCLADNDLARLQVAYYTSPAQMALALSFRITYNPSLLDLVGFGYMDGMSHDAIQTLCPLFDVEELEPGTISFTCVNLIGDASIPADIANVLSVWVQAKAGASGSDTVALQCNNGTSSSSISCTGPPTAALVVGGCATDNTAADDTATGRRLRDAGH
jgi:hypothetical protein